MKQHNYKVSIKHISDKDGNTVNETPLVFNMPSHDNIADILSHFEKNPHDFNQETATRFVIGLKLLGEVLLENRQHSFFSQFEPHFREIMHIVKGKK